MYTLAEQEHNIVRLVNFYTKTFIGRATVVQRLPKPLARIVAWIRAWQYLRSLKRQKLIAGYCIPKLNIFTGKVGMEILPYSCLNFVQINTIVRG